MLSKDVLLVTSYSSRRAERETGARKIEREKKWERA